VGLGGNGDYAGAHSTCEWRAVKDGKKRLKSAISDTQFTLIEHIRRLDDLGIEAPKIDIEREAHQTSAYRFPTGIISLIKLYIISNVSPKVTRLSIFLFTLAFSFSRVLLCLRFEECE